MRDMHRNNKSEQFLHNTNKISTLRSYDEINTQVLSCSQDIQLLAFVLYVIINILNHTNWVKTVSLVHISKSCVHLY